MAAKLPQILTSMCSVNLDAVEPALDGEVRSLEKSIHNAVYVCFGHFARREEDEPVQKRGQCSGQDLSDTSRLLVCTTRQLQGNGAWSKRRDERISTS